MYRYSCFLQHVKKSCQSCTAVASVASLTGALFFCAWLWSLSFAFLCPLSRSALIHVRSCSPLVWKNVSVKWHIRLIADIVALFALWACACDINQANDTTGRQKNTAVHVALLVIKPSGTANVQFYWYVETYDLPPPAKPRAANKTSRRRRRRPD